MSMSLSGDGTTKVITVSGEIDMSNAHLLVELVEFLSDPPAPNVALDLSTVTHFGAHGISALLRAQELVISSGGRLRVSAVSPFVLYILGVTGMTPHLGIDVAPSRPGTVPAAGPPVVAPASLPGWHGGGGRPAPRRPLDTLAPPGPPAASG
ncbi:STAS domain-containing protein [Micromonospora sp. CPCC 205561]|uniref:STAS domain-containing protein n=1 Tax=Micromonospora sp. CPCC 205561 TaxID=3122407 RepID=UPI002FF2074C